MEVGGGREEMERGRRKEGMCRKLNKELRGKKEGKKSVLSECCRL